MRHEEGGTADSAAASETSGLDSNNGVKPDGTPSRKTPKPLNMAVGSIQIHALNVQISEDLTLDELHLEGGDLALTEGKPEPIQDEWKGGNGNGGAANGTGQANAQAGNALDMDIRFTSGETQVRAVISEPNLNRLLAANLPADLPIRNVRVAALTGKIRVMGDLARVFSLPISLEATPIVQNGVKVSADWKGLNAGKIALPGPLRDVLEQYLNKTLDLTKSPVPIYVTEVRCEPGRITVLGKARLAYPLALAQMPPRLVAVPPQPPPTVPVESSAGSGALPLGDEPS